MPPVPPPVEMPFGRFSYLLILLLWVAPIFLIQWLVAGRALWRARRLLAATTLLCGTFLSLADHYAIARGIWQIHDAGIVGWRFQGHIPLEEALFFYLTSAMSAQGFVMLAYHFRRKGTRAL